MSQVYREHFAFVWRQLVRLGLDSASAEDAAQEVFLVFYRRAHELASDRSPRAWLYGTCRRVASRSRRNLARRARTCGEYLDCLQANHSTRGDMPAHDLELGLATAIAALDDEKRDVFVLGQLEGMTGRELAECLEINPNTAASRLRAARAAVAQAMDSTPGPRQNQRPRGLSQATLRRQAVARKRVWAALLPIPGLAKASVGGMASMLGAVTGSSSGVLTTSLALVAVSTVVWTGGLKASPEPSGARQVARVEHVDTTQHKPTPSARADDARSHEPPTAPEPVRPASVDPNVAPLAELKLRTKPKAPAKPRQIRQSRPRPVATTPAASPRPEAPTLRAGELKLMKRIRAATLAGNTAALDRLTLRYLERYPGGIFESEIRRTRLASKTRNRDG